MKRAYKQGMWRAKEKGRCYRKHWARRQEPEEDKPAVLAPDRISIPSPQVDNRQSGPRSPNRNSPRASDTPVTESHHLDAPESWCADPTYTPPDTPQSRCELGTTRQSPPITCLRSRLQALQEASNQEDNQVREQLSE